LLDGVPKEDGFFSLSPHESDDVFSLIYGATNDFPRLDDYLGVSQMTATDEDYHWQPRETFLPLVTAGQKPVFLDEADTLHAMTESNFDGSKIVYLSPEERQFVTVAGQAQVRVIGSKFSTQGVQADVESDRPSLVVVAQTFYPAWRAEVDGQFAPLLRANHAFQALQVPQGRHHIQLVYQDRAFEIGAVISIIAWIVCVPACLITRVSRRMASSNLHVSR